MKTISSAVASVIIGALGMLWAGFVLTILWKWFVIPAFSAPSLTVTTAAGIYCIVGLLTKLTKFEMDLSTKSASQVMYEQIIIATMRPIAFLLVGWLIHVLV